MRGVGKLSAYFTRVQHNQGTLASLKIFLVVALVLVFGLSLYFSRKAEAEYDDEYEHEAFKHDLR
jgi:Zn-dependent protease with chaperone function